MNVWITRARKKATCTYELCKDTEIPNDSYYVVCQWVMRTRGGKNWRKQRVFHIPCWVNRAIAELERRVVPETRGRQKMAITDTHRSERLKILRKRAALVQRIKAATIACQFERVQRLVDKLEQCKTAIEQFGGTPKGW